MEKRVETMFDPKRSGPVQLKKMKPLKKSDILEMYEDIGMDPDFHNGFYDLNKDFKVMNKVKGRIHGMFNLMKLQGKLDNKVKTKQVDNLCESLEHGKELSMSDIKSLNDQMKDYFIEQHIVKNENKIK